MPELACLWNRYNATAVGGVKFVTCHRLVDVFLPLNKMAAVETVAGYLNYLANLYVCLYAVT